jgi:hypothetical protein
MSFALKSSRAAECTSIVMRRTPGAQDGQIEQLVSSGFRARSRTSPGSLEGTPGAPRSREEKT